MVNTVILGASNKPERYSYKAQQALIKHRHSVILVNPNFKEINGCPCYASLDELKQTFDTPIDTITIYVRPDILQPLIPSIVELRPRRVIFNPGSESEFCATVLQENGIEVSNACTLVLLATNQY